MIPFYLLSDAKICIFLQLKLRGGRLPKSGPMRLKPKHIFLAAIVLINTPVFLATGQESSFPVMDAAESEKEKNQYYPSSESEKSTYRQPTDSVAIKPVQVKVKTSEAQKQSEKGAPKGGGEDSVLSFNFLYYFIQKFKMSDIVDQ